MEDKRYARMVAGAKFEKVSLGRAPRTGPRQFAKANGFVPVPPETERYLKLIRVNGEPIERGGEGGPLFEFASHEEMVMTLDRESRIARAKAAGKQALQAELIAIQREEAERQNGPVPSQVDLIRMLQSQANTIAALERRLNAVESGEPTKLRADGGGQSESASAAPAALDTGSADGGAAPGDPQAEDSKSDDTKPPVVRVGRARSQRVGDSKAQGE